MQKRKENIMSEQVRFKYIQYFKEYVKYISSEIGCLSNIKCVFKN